MPTDVTLRRALAGDTDQLASVHLDARRHAPMPPGVHSEEEVRVWLAGRLRSDDEVWVAELDGTVAAYARMTETWLDDLYVAPSSAGQGIGSALLDLVKSLRPGGFSLWVFESNTPARAFYEHRGLVALERTDGPGNEEREPDIKMAWPGVEPLGYYRRLIDEVDEQLGDLLARRVALTRAVQDHKRDPTRDPAREREIAERLAVHAPALGADRLGRIVHAIITESLDSLDD
ncbi:MAG: GNAT family N-acetyltransferase [Nocardioides sp.]